MNSMNRPFEMRLVQGAAPLTTLRSLESAGVKFVIAVPTESGLADQRFSPEDVVLYLQEPEELYAKCHGVTRAQFRDWSEGPGQCDMLGNDEERHAL
jgi:hypothetical protein